MDIGASAKLVLVDKFSYLGDMLSARQMQENFRVKGKSSILVLWIWRKGAKRTDKLDNA